MIEKRLEFGKIVRSIRKSKGLSQEDVEWETGISTKTISRLETGAFKEASVSYLMELSKLYNEEILSLYIKICFESNYLYRDIINSLDMTARFMKETEILSLYQKLEILEKDRTFRNKERDLRILRLFIDKIYHKELSFTEYRDRFSDIQNNNLNRVNILRYNYSDLELRILLLIINHFKSYDGIEGSVIIDNLLKSTKGRYINIFVSNIKINTYITNKKFKEALLLINKEIIFARTNRFYDCLAFLYYDKFICEYKLNINSFKETLNIALLLANMTDTSLSEIIANKVKNISI